MNHESNSVGFFLTLFRNVSFLLNPVKYSKQFSVDTSAEAYKDAMTKRAERLKKEQFVKEKRLKEVQIKHILTFLI